MPTPDARLARLAASRHGTFDLAEARAAGLSDAALRHRVATGTVVRLHEQVFRFEAAPETWRTSLVAAVLAGGHTAVASHRSAGRLWELRGVPRWKPEITCLGRRLPLIDDVVVHRTDRLEPVDLGIVDAVPCTSVDRTLLDLGAVVHRRVVRTAAEDAVIAGRTTVLDLVCTLERLGGHGRRGTAALRWAVRSCLPVAGLESRLEAWVLDVIRGAGIPTPRSQHELRCRDGRFVRLDFAWPERRLAIEADGRRWHSTAADFERDMARSNSVAATGWTLYRFGWTDVHQRRAEVASLLRTVFADRTAA